MANVAKSPYIAWPGWSVHPRTTSPTGSRRLGIDIDATCRRNSPRTAKARRKRVRMMRLEQCSRGVLPRRRNSASKTGTLWSLVCTLASFASLPLSAFTGSRRSSCRARVRRARSGRGVYSRRSKRPTWSRTSCFRLSVRGCSRLPLC